MDMLNPKFLKIFLGLLLMLVGIYAPALFIPWGHHEDFLYFERAPGTLQEYVGWEANVAIGRFIGALLSNWMGWTVLWIEDLFRIRLFNIVVLSWAAAAVITRLVPTRGKIWDVCLGALILLTLPAFSIWICYSGISFHTLSISIGIFSALIADRIPMSWSFKTLFKNQLYWLAVLLHYAALSIYQTGAMCYWPVALIIFCLNWRNSFSSLKNKTLILTAVGMTGIVIYYLNLLLLKPLVQRGAIGDYQGLYNPYAISLDVSGKLKWFLDEPLVNTLNLWNIAPSHLTAGLVLTGILLGIALLINAQKNKIFQEPGKIFLSALVFSAALILSFLPNLAASGNASWYRCLAGLSIFSVVVGYYALQGWLLLVPKKFRRLTQTVIFLVIFLFGAGQTQKNILWSRVLPSYVEFQTIKNNLTVADLEQTREIRYILPSIHSPRSQSEEFGSQTMDFPGVSLFALTLYAIREILRDADMPLTSMRIDHAKRWMHLESRQPGGKPVHLRFVMTAHRVDKKFPEFPGTFIIDLHDFSYGGGVR